MANKSEEQTPKVEQKDVCFVIMPFGGWSDKYYTSIFRPAIEAAGLLPHRADDLFRPSTIVNDIWAFTNKARIILADLTGKNPNVFYELGLAHALAKPAVLVTETMDDVPFDLRALRVLEYDKNQPDWGVALERKISRSIEEVLESPAEAVLPAFLSVSSSSKRTTVTPERKELLELKRDMDLLRRELRSRRHLSARRISLEPDEARAVIERSLARGLSIEDIIERLEPLGPPEDWIIREAQELMSAQGILFDRDLAVPDLPNKTLERDR